MGVDVVEATHGVGVRDLFHPYGRYGRAAEPRPVRRAGVTCVRGACPAVIDGWIRYGSARGGVGAPSVT